jgi:hypothetical protein
MVSWCDGSVDFVRCGWWDDLLGVGDGIAKGVRRKAGRYGPGNFFGACFLFDLKYLACAHFPGGFPLSSQQVSGRVPEEVWAV